MKICIIHCFDTYEHRVDLLHDYFKAKGTEVTVITSDYMHFEKRKIRFPLKEELKYFYDNFQISLLYCSIVLSDEKKPALLMLISAFFAHALRSV